MRLIIVKSVFFLSFAPWSISAQVKDTSVAEALCISRGFERHTEAFGTCVILNMTKLKDNEMRREGQVANTNQRPADNYVSPANSHHTRPSFGFPRYDHVADYGSMIKAARAGDTSAFVPLARYYMDGSGVSADPKKGLFWLRKAEQSRNPEAYPLLALAYLEGQGVPQDIQKAFSFVEVARNAGAESQSQEIERILKQRFGDDAITCAGYGMALGTPQNGQCRLQLQQARQLAEQQAQLARQQELFAQQQARFAQQQYELQAQQYQRQLAADRLARDAQERAESRAASESLRQLSEDLLCPKQGPGPFAPPVAGCGSNKHVPRPPTVNVIVNTEARDCRYRTAAGCH